MGFDTARHRGLDPVKSFNLTTPLTPMDAIFALQTKIWFQIGVDSLSA